jgi:hypothetical protein
MKKLVLAGIYLTGIKYYVSLLQKVASTAGSQFNLFSMAAKKLSL